MSTARTITRTIARRPFTDDEDQLIVDLSDAGLPLAAIAERLGRLGRDIYQRRVILDRARGVLPCQIRGDQLRPGWSQAQAMALVAFHRDKKMSAENISRCLGKTLAEVRAQAAAIDLDVE